MEITTARVVNSTPVGLVLISYEVIIDEIEKNMLNIEEGKDVNLVAAKNFIRDLSKSLDMEYEISSNLKALYIFINGLLINAEITNDINKKKKCLLDAKNIMKILYSGWEKVEKSENTKEAVMDNVDLIYSGLTYGTKGLNETVLGKTNRGIKA